MGDVQLPLKLSTSYYIGISTSNQGEHTSPSPNATLFTFTKPTLGFFRLRNFTKNKKSYGTKDGNPKKVMVSLHWPFLSAVKSQGLETSSPSSSKDTSSNGCSSVHNKGDGVESSASQKSPLERSSPVSSVSPSSVLSKELFIEKEAGSNENGGRKIRWDSFESYMSCNDVPKLSNVSEGEKEMEWNTSKSFARSTPCNVVEQGRANFVKDIDGDDDEYIELELSKSKSSSIYGDPLTSLRRSSGSDILKVEDSNIIENGSEISEEEIQWDDFRLFDGHDANQEKASEVAPNLAESKKTVTCNGDNNPLFVVKLFERFSVSDSLGLFTSKMLRAIGFLRGSYSTILWMSLKKRIVLLAASQINLRLKQVVKISGGGEELWKKNIPMGRRCRVLELEDHSCADGERQLKEVAAEAAADVRMNSYGDGVMAEGFSLGELMEMAAEAPAFNWYSK